MLEGRAVAAADWAAALAVRETRLRAEAEAAAAERLGLLKAAATSPSTTEGRIKLPFSLARLEGVSIDPISGHLKNWLSSGSQAVWKLPDLPPGGYEVILRYSSSATQGGTVQVREATYSLTAPTKITLKGPEEFNIGTLRISQGAGPLTIAATGVSKGGFIDLVSVELESAKD